MLCLKAAPERLALKAKYEPYIKCSGHLTPVLNPERRRHTVNSVIRVLRYHEFDAIAFRGLSGALIAPIVAMEMDKTLLAVRKREEHRHSEMVVEGDLNAKRYVILDDLVSMGTTVKAIISEVATVAPAAKCIGVLRYLFLSDNAGAEGVESVESVL
jgi:orotate phosphoribosyltransferase-like protein